jgi:phosphoribosyl 1,2-cyclic phosphodiesterase
MIKFCSLYSGSSGNSIFFSSGKTRILIDAGISAKKIIEALNSIGENPRELDAILVTHEHSDHIKCLGVMSRKFGIPIFANEKTWGAIESEIGHVDSANKIHFSTDQGFEIGNIGIEPFQIPHDAADPLGYKLSACGRKVATATDIGHISDRLLDSIGECDILLLESNHDVEMLKVGSYPYWLKRRILSDLGHLSNELAGKVVVHLAEMGTRIFILGHLSKENNFPELAYQTVYNALHEKRLSVGTDVTLEVALRDKVGRVIEM